MSKGPFKLRSGNTTPFKTMGSSPAKQIPVTKGESYKEYLNRAFKETKDPYAQDVLSKKGYGTQARQLKQDAKKTTRSIYKGVKNKITNVAKKFGASDKTIEKASRLLTKGKQFIKRVPKAGPVGAAITTATIAKPVIEKVAKETIEGLKERAKSGNVNIGRKL